MNNLTTESGAPHYDGPTLPETNIALENRPSQKEISSSNHQISGSILVSGRVSFLCSR